MRDRISRFRLATKVLVPVAAALIFITAALVFQSFRSQREAIIESEDAKLTTAYESFVNYVDDRGNQALALALEIANQPTAQAAMAAQDRETLEAEYLGTYQLLNDQFGIPQGQFHLPPATSLLRLHKPDKFGDDLSSFRHTVVNTNATQTATYGIEVGRGGPGIRGVVPVFYEDNHVGSFEMGLSLNTGSLEGLKESYGGEWHIVLDSNAGAISSLDGFKLEEPGPVEGTLSFAGTSEAFLPVPAATFDAVFSEGSLTIDRVSSEAGDPYAVLTGPVTDYSGQVIGALQVEYSRADVLAAINSARNEALAIGLIITVVSLGIIYLIVRVSLGSLDKLKLAAESLAQGDTSVELPESRFQDEVGEMIHSFRDTIEYLQEASRIAEKMADGDLTEDFIPRSEEDMLGNALTRMSSQLREVLSEAVAVSAKVEAGSDLLAQSSEESARAASDVAGSISDVAAGAGTQAQISEAVASAVKRIVTSVGTASAAVEDVAEASAAAKENADAGRQSIDEASRSMSNITNRFSEASETVAEVRTHSARVEEIVDLIKDIAGQTNLLALNAAIEAARAGEAGRGFAVVASEVKTLAEESERSTEQIAEIVDEMRTSVQRAITAMEAGSSDVSVGAEVVTTAGDSFAAIADSIETISGKVGRVASSASEIKVAADAIDGEADNLVMVTESNSNASEQVAAASEQAAATSQEIGATAQDLQTSAASLVAAMQGFRIE
jgi:methyl-accepting chemotaxis protein